MFNKEKLITYNGDNSELFVRRTVDKKLDRKAEIVVPSTHVALIIKDGEMQETLKPGRYQIYDKTGTLSRLFDDTKSVEIIYMSNTAKLRMRWGTASLLDLRDPITDIMTKVGANGELEIQVGEPRQFYLELVGMDKNYSIEKLQERILNKLMSEFKPALAKTMREKNLSYFLVDEHTKDISLSISPIISKMLIDDYGVKMFSFYINKIFIPDDTKQAIEVELKRIKMKNEEKMEAKEYVAELERLQDKEWEKEKYMNDLRTKDYEKYLEVCKIVGWKSNSSGGIFCSQCGAAYTSTDAFCGKCGKRVGNSNLVCPICYKENAGTAAFCSACGHKFK